MAFLVHVPGAGLAGMRGFPVLYLLHGSGHDRFSVLRGIRPQDHLQALGEAVLVIPDGDQGWWLDSPALPRSRYGQYVMELTRFVDHRYPTVPTREARGICGFSMGGYGAILLAAQHRECFGSASSLLGPLDIAQLFPDYYRLRLLLGDDLSTWQHHNPTQLVTHLVGTSLLFCTAETAFDRPHNDAFATALRARGIPFEYQVYPGAHDTMFVREHLAEHLSFHRRQFDLAAR